MSTWSTIEDQNRSGLNNVRKRKITSKTSHPRVSTVPDFAFVRDAHFADSNLLGRYINFRRVCRQRILGFFWPVAQRIAGWQACRLVPGVISLYRMAGFPGDDLGISAPTDIDLTNPQALFRVYSNVTGVTLSSC